MPLVASDTRGFVALSSRDVVAMRHLHDEPSPRRDDFHNGILPLWQYDRLPPEASSRSALASSQRCVVFHYGRVADCHLSRRSLATLPLLHDVTAAIMAEWQTAT